MARASTCYVKVASKSCWVNNDRGRARGSMADVSRSSQQEWPMRLIEVASYAWMTIMASNFKILRIYLLKLLPT